MTTRWTWEDTKYLLKHYGEKPTYLIASTLGRSEQAVYDKVRKLRKNGYKFK